MTPERRKLVMERAAQLRARLNAAVTGADLDIVQIAQEAHRLFEDAEDETRTRWMVLELGGYGDLVDERPLHDVLRVPLHDRLIAHVAAYRTQRGEELAPSPSHRVHFFVEALSQLVGARTVVRARWGGGEGTLEVDLNPRGSLSGYPARIQFQRDVFERILSGFSAALFLQLGSVGK